MGPIDWLAVVLAAAAAQLLALGWYRRGGRIARKRHDTRVELVSFLLLLVSAAMLGHMFARIDTERWWLYPMMSGGLALAFVVPALWSSYTRRKVRRSFALRDGAYWLLAFLLMGGVFWMFRG